MVRHINFTILIFGAKLCQVGPMYIMYKIGGCFGGDAALDPQGIIDQLNS